MSESEIQEFLDEADRRIRQATDSKAGTTLSGAAVVEAPPEEAPPSGSGWSSTSGTPAPTCSTTGRSSA
ncbi:hypothetical protein [Nesterenkonia pannonica]|uniref:hypothetical protein n=1 Tax=Nesterenkonia pannonica TaxID=1548602 RepID=UPI0021646A2A|nr:hypothetical protein [Nesterenkonia pannonica]